MEPKILTLEELKEKLSDRVYMVVSKRTGLSNITVSGIATGRITDPAYKTLRLLSKYFEDHK